MCSTCKFSNGFNNFGNRTGFFNPAVANNNFFNPTFGNPAFGNPAFGNPAFANNTPFFFNNINNRIFSNQDHHRFNCLQNLSKCDKVNTQPLLHFGKSKKHKKEKKHTCQDDAFEGLCKVLIIRSNRKGHH